VPCEEKEVQITIAPDETILTDGKVVTALDRFVASVMEIIERYTRDVIVSGYVAILFGMARGTEDIDLFVDYMDRDTSDHLPTSSWRKVSIS